ncbi:MAG TPA: hypothetical protein VF954_06590 [Acidimicrobiales bacterium]
MLLAELEIRHSRAVAPTRRVALGELWLPTDPSPGFGGILIAGIVATFIAGLDEEMHDGLETLLTDVEGGRRVVQPRLRHRFQHDVVGLDRSRHTLIGHGEHVRLELDDHGAAMPQILGALYAAGQLSYSARPSVWRLIRRATRWEGAAGDALVAYLTGDEAAFRVDRLAVHGQAWALQVLGFPRDAAPERDEVLRRFRSLIRHAHPDHGGQTEGAGTLIHQLTQAKRILAGT